MSLGEQIKQARENKNLSQEELAEKLGVTRQAVSKWENDISIPQGINRELISQVLELEMLSAKTEPDKNLKWNYFGWIGWGIAFILMVLLMVAICMKGEEKRDISETEREMPVFKSITFYDNQQNEVKQEALWYDAAQIDSILVQWKGGTPNNIKIFLTPSGSETEELTKLLLTKSILDGESAVLLNADSIKEEFQAHITFEMDFGGNKITSEIYNVYNHEK